MAAGDHEVDPLYVDTDHGKHNSVHLPYQKMKNVIVYDGSPSQILQLPMLWPWWPNHPHYYMDYAFLSGHILRDYYETAVISNSQNVK